jgi:hypothetical protein
MGARFYDARIARFTSPDFGVQVPGWTQAYNKFSYAWNNPYSWVDPFGLENEGEYCNSGTCTPFDVAPVDYTAASGVAQSTPAAPTADVATPNASTPTSDVLFENFPMEISGSPTPMGAEQQDREPPSVAFLGPVSDSLLTDAAPTVARSALGPMALGILVQSDSDQSGRPASNPGVEVSSAPLPLPLEGGEGAGGTPPPGRNYADMDLPEGPSSGGRGGRAEGAEGAYSRVLEFTPRDLQKGFMKHGADFGLKGNWNPARAGDFGRAINQFINSKGVVEISGTYRGEAVTHFFNPATGENVIATPTGEYVSGWTLSVEQMQSLFRTGAIQ